MISYHEALEVLHQFADMGSLKNETTLLSGAVGRILSEDIHAPECSPPFDNSAMDGFAINYESTKRILQESPSGVCDLRVIECVAAGDEIAKFDHSLFSEPVAVEIMTGAPLPHEFFDTVVKIEDVEIKENSATDSLTQLKKVIRLNQLPEKHEHIRRAGEDFQIGDALLKKGTRIEHAHLLGLATLGISQVKVFCRPVVAIASTGKELVPHETKSLTPGKIRNSTGLYLQTKLTAIGCSIINLGIVSDTPEAYKEAVRRAFAEGAKIFLSTGAVSMGQYDFVKPALLEMGAQIHFHKCAIRPGKPILFATLDFEGQVKYIFGIPGNAVSTTVGLEFFVMPFLQRFQKENVPSKTFAILDEDVSKPEGLTTFFKAKVASINGENRVKALRGQASFMVSPLLRANSWLILPEKPRKLSRGERVEVCDL